VEFRELILHGVVVDLLNHVFHAHNISKGRARAFFKGAKLAVGFANIGGVDVEVVYPVDVIANLWGRTQHAGSIGQNANA
jgi:hypothetical protein